MAAMALLRRRLGLRRLVGPLARFAQEDSGGGATLSISTHPTPIGMHTHSRWLHDLSGSWRTAYPLKVHGNIPSYRMTAVTKCKFGGPRFMMTTNEKVQVNSPVLISTTKSHNLEEDFHKKLGQYLAGGLVVSLVWFLYAVMSALGLDVGLLDKLRGQERVLTEENKTALKALAEILERKDGRLTRIKEENEKIREESQRASEVHKKEISAFEEEISGLLEEVRDLKEAICALEEHVKTNAGSKDRSQGRNPEEA